MVVNLTLAFQVFLIYRASELTLLYTLVRYLCRPGPKEFETGNPKALLFDVCYWAYISGDVAKLSMASAWKVHKPKPISTTPQLLGLTLLVKTILFSFHMVTDKDR